LAKTPKIGYFGIYPKIGVFHCGGETHREGSIWILICRELPGVVIYQFLIKSYI